MHVWNAQALAEALRDDVLSERQKLHYVLGAAVLTALFLGGWSGVAEWLRVGYVTIMVAGVVACFQANERGDGRRFVERYVCLGFPVLVRWMVLTYGLYYGAWLVNGALGGRPAAALAVSPAVLYGGFVLAMEIVYYVWLARWIGHAARDPSESAGPTERAEPTGVGRATTADHGA